MSFLPNLKVTILACLATAVFPLVAGCATDTDDETQPPAESTDEAVRRGATLERVGDCADSTIKFVGPRLEDDDDWSSGVFVKFANGVSQWSYEVPDALRKSRAGDPVRICVTDAGASDICPENVRHEYKVKNKRTQKSWQLWNSDRECG